ncbi:Glyco_hydro_19_cat domain-containing protein [Psidium guajava]|nr:Glyco_hydro_19_cat domain-containing protein [Psidium guajava]
MDPVPSVADVISILVAELEPKARGRHGCGARARASWPTSSRSMATKLEPRLAAAMATELELVKSAF